MVPHYRIHNTALAAALATLGVPLDPTEPYARLVDTATDREQITFLFRDRSQTDETRRTEYLIGVWEKRAPFEAAHPDHPLVFMRAAHDARGFLVKVVHGETYSAWRDTKAAKHVTPHLSEAAILRAHGFPLGLFTGSAFVFPAAHRGVHARQILDQSQRAHGQTPARWQALFMVNFNRFLAVVKGTPILVTREDNAVALFSADMPQKEQNRWLDMLA